MSKKPLKPKLKPAAARSAVSNKKTLAKNVRADEVIGEIDDDLESLTEDETSLAEDMVLDDAEVPPSDTLEEDLAEDLMAADEDDVESELVEDLNLDDVEDKEPAEATASEDAEIDLGLDDAAPATELADAAEVGDEAEVAEVESVELVDAAVEDVPIEAAPAPVLAGPGRRPQPLGKELCACAHCSVEYYLPREFAGYDAVCVRCKKVFAINFRGATAPRADSDRVAAVASAVTLPAQPVTDPTAAEAELSETDLDGEAVEPEIADSDDLGIMVEDTEPNSEDNLESSLEDDLDVELSEDNEEKTDATHKELDRAMDLDLDDDPVPAPADAPSNEEDMGLDLADDPPVEMRDAQDDGDDMNLDLEDEQPAPSPAADDELDLDLAEEGAGEAGENDDALAAVAQPKSVAAPKPAAAAKSAAQGDSLDLDFDLGDDPAPEGDEEITSMEDDLIPLDELPDDDVIVIEKKPAAKAAATQPASKAAQPVKKKAEDDLDLDLDFDLGEEAGAGKS